MSKYITQELARYWPVSSELLAQYRDGTHTTKDRYGLYWLNQNNLFHRYGDKPAVIGRNGYLEWRQNGQRHRSHGPSVIRPNGTLEWWINDEDITQEVNEWLAEEEWHGTPEQIVEFQLRFT